MIATRVDEQVFHKEGILERIYNQIDATDFIIADMTGRNPNVFYEVGYAHAKGKLCILLTSDADDIPFDLKHKRHIVYNSSISTLKSKLKTDLVALKDEIDAKDNHPVSVELNKIDGLLTKTRFYATAEVDIYLDFHNRTYTTSEEIETIYFYTGDDWSFRQDSQESAKTKSDLDDFHLRHLIKHPVRRLTPGGWAQVTLVGKKILSYAREGEELKDSYRLKGKVIVVL